MGFLDFFNHDAEKLLAKDLVENFVKNLPPKLMLEKRHILSANKISRLLERAIETAKEHQTKTGMGFIKRVVFASSLKSELISRGYPQDFTDVATESLIVELSRKSKTITKK